MFRSRVPAIRIVAIALLLAGGIAPVHRVAADTRVLVFTPTTADNSYWPQVYDILEAAAADSGPPMTAPSSSLPATPTRGCANVQQRSIPAPT